MITLALTETTWSSVDKFGSRKPLSNLSYVSLTKFHQQGQEDPQRDLKGLLNFFVMEGEDGESLFMTGGVSLVMRVVLCRPGWISPRLVASRNNITTRRGNGDENEQ